MNTAYATFIETDDYIPGILALRKSLFEKNSRKDFLIITTKRSLSHEALNVLSSLNCKIKIVDEINPTPLIKLGKESFNHYTKLNVFGLTEYDKIIFLDADLLICANIESLFSMHHMSSVVAGGLIAENNWIDLNGGLLVIEPSKQLLTEILDAVKWLPSNDGTDQGFLQSFYKDWPLKKQLHLDHTFNVPTQYLDIYCDEFGFEFSYTNNMLNTNISVLHYWGQMKPWMIHPDSGSFTAYPKLTQAVCLWWDFYDAALKEISYP